MSKLIRRTHMYLALFLAPWVLMYAFSTCVMNHHSHLHAPGDEEPWTVERELDYDGTFPDGASDREKGRQILQSLGLDGAHVVRSGQAITILRTELRRKLRIRFAPDTKRITVEAQHLPASGVLEQLHRRRGYEHDYVLVDIWAASVDLVVIVMLFLALSGLWMWWELKTTRRLGTVFLVGGLALFSALVWSI